MKITVIGAGYVGLVTAACFSDLGNEVVCVEKLESKLDQLRAGQSPIYEPNLSDILKRNIQNGRLRFIADIEEGVHTGDIIFLCVGTPQSETGKADLSQIEEASRQIATYMRGYKLIIEKSTVPVNTHSWVKRTLERYAAPGMEFDVASNPEFLREGSAIHDFMNPDRVVVGMESKRAEKLFKELYRPFEEKGFPVVYTTTAAAELIKHASNSFLAMKISYINMVSNLCEKVGADVTKVAEGMGYDKRIGRAFLNAGIGYGGSCFPKDVKAFIKMAEENGVDFGLLKETEKINASRRAHFINKIEEVLWINKDKKIAVWGLAFKPDTDDIREAPAITVVRELREAGANLYLYDPQATANFKMIFPEEDHLHYTSSSDESVQDADALLILTEWDEFKEVDLDALKNKMRLPIILDSRNLFEPSQMKSKGFEYYSIGR